ncbi:hypothetical protein ILP97_00890 [Amycolatopsis sp. H6(2020)]|nr:hypothetical protein [Amycolatopsis sp. H6(2020)]
MARQRLRLRNDPPLSRPGKGTGKGKRFARAAAVVAGTVAAAAVATAPVSAASGAGTAGLECGYDRDLTGAIAFYTHCDPSTWVVITIVRGSIFVPSELCVGPGQTRLGLAQNYLYAYYAGRLC